MFCFDRNGRQVLLNSRRQANDRGGDFSSVRANYDGFGQPPKLVGFSCLCVFHLADKLLLFFVV